jgi:hypothetical protein
LTGLGAVVKNQGELDAAVKAGADHIEIDKDHEHQYWTAPEGYMITFVKIVDKSVAPAAPA